jgi:hypothetical protein
VNLPLTLAEAAERFRLQQQAIDRAALKYQLAKDKRITTPQETRETMFYYDPKKFDVQLEIASQPKQGTWAAQLKSIASPSTRSAGRLNVHHLTDQVEQHNRLLATALLSSLGGMRLRAFDSIKAHTGRPKPRLKLRAPEYFLEAIQGKSPFKENAYVRAQIDELLSRFAVTFEPIKLADFEDSAMRRELNTFARNTLFKDIDPKLLRDPIKPHAIALAEQRNVRYLKPLTPAY